MNSCIFARHGKIIDMTYFPIIKHNEVQTVATNEYTDIFYGYRFNLEDLPKTDCSDFLSAMSMGCLNPLRESLIDCEPFFTVANKYPKDRYYPSFPFHFESNTKINNAEFKVFRNLTFRDEVNNVLFDGCNVYFNTKTTDENAVIEGVGNFEFVLWYRAIDYTGLECLTSEQLKTKHFNQIMGQEAHNIILPKLKYNPTLSNSETPVVKIKGLS